MPRKRRIVAVGFPHHITHRSHNRAPIFFTPADRKTYLDSFFRYAAQYQLTVLGYCLMTNHVHVLALPKQQDSLAQVLGRTQSDYARRNPTARTVGRGQSLAVPSNAPHLWQSRFYSKPLEYPLSWHVLAYIERNPVRAGMVNQAERYPWSSARVHCSGNDPENRVDLTAWRESYSPERWQEVLATSIFEEGLQERIREGARTFERRLAEQNGKGQS